jgi:MoaA/NifB/PqqE/SkfB family radical SAM enzyme
VSLFLQQHLRTLRERPGARAFLHEHLHLPVGDATWRLNVDPTVGCNLRCSFCINTPARRRACAEPSVLDAIAERVLPHAASFVVGCRHEPLLHPTLPAWLSRLHQQRLALPHRVELTLLTSGSLLDDRLRHAVLTSGLDELGLSVDTTDPATYEALRPPATWAVLERVVRAALRETAGTPTRVSMLAVLIRATVRHLPTTVETLHAFGARSFCLGQLVHNVRGPEVGPLVFRDDPSLGPLLDGVEAWCRAHDAMVGVPRPAPAPLPDELYPSFGDGSVRDEHLRVRESPSVCALPWCELRVDHRGLAYPCFMMLDARHAWGSLLTSSFEAVVNGPQAVSMRRELLRGRAPNAVCARCPFGPSRSA